jgi:hemin uptake protein HemP
MQTSPALARRSPEPPSRDTPPRHDARSLTDGGPAAEIALDDKTYTLRITRQGKLILTK